MLIFLEIKNKNADVIESANQNGDQFEL